MGDVVLYLLICDVLLLNHDGEKASSRPAITALPSAKADDDLNEQPDIMPPEFRFSSITCTLPADASIAELINIILSKIIVPTNPTKQSQVSDAKILRDQQLDQVTILDVSYPPAKVITCPAKMYTEKTGPLCKTLHSMGWYPSGKLVILPSPRYGHLDKNESPTTATPDDENILLEKFLNWHSRHKHDDEFAYNLPNDNRKNAFSKHDEVSKSESVQWIGGGAEEKHVLKPSDIFNAVEQRFDNSTIDNNMPYRKLQTEKKSKRRLEKERQERLDVILQKIENARNKGNKKKTKDVSQKVRTMLLKSRSEGNKKLRMEDRFHLEIFVVFDDGSDGSSSDESNSTRYRFFSTATTAGRVASTVAPSLGNDRASEFLVALSPAIEGVNEAWGGENNKKNPTSKKIYKRLPNTMTLDEARNKGWLNEFDVVVVRVYSIKSVGDEQGQHGPSRSVLDSDVETEDGNDGNFQNKTQSCNKSIPNTAVSESESLHHLNALALAEANGAQVIDESQQPLQKLIQKLLTTTDDVPLDNDRLPRKKKKPVSHKVQHMLLKSKAIGNAKLNEEDRIYLEIVTFHDNGSSSEHNINQNRSTSCHFFSKGNCIQYLIDRLAEGQATQNEFIIATHLDEIEKKVYKKLPPTLKLGLAVEMGLIANFDRVLILSSICEESTSPSLCED